MTNRYKYFINKRDIWLFFRLWFHILFLDPLLENNPWVFSNLRKTFSQSCGPFRLHLIFPLQSLIRLGGDGGGRGWRWGLQPLFPSLWCGLHLHCPAPLKVKHWSPPAKSNGFFLVLGLLTTFTLLATFFETLPSLAGIPTNLSVRSIF